MVDPSVRRWSKTELSSESSDSGRDGGARVSYAGGSLEPGCENLPLDPRSATTSSGMDEDIMEVAFEYLPRGDWPGKTL